MAIWNRRKEPEVQTDPIVDEARDRFELCVQTEKEIREEARIDQQFVAGKQWNPEAQRMRENDDRPVITINKMPPFVQGIANSARLNKPSIKIVRGDNKATLPTAEVYEGLIRRIQYESSATTARSVALDNAASCSMGHYRVNAKYEDSRARFQSLVIEPLPDPLSVYFDPSAIEYDRSDSNFCFVDSHVSKDEFKRRWPKAKLSEANFFEGSTNPAPEWIGLGNDQGFVRLAEYWVVEKKDRYLCYLPGEETQFEDELTDEELATLPKGKDGKPEGRMETDRTVKMHLINGVEILETSEWPGRWIPIIPVYGKEMYVDGKRELYSVVRFQRDPQRLYNFYATTEAELISDAPKAPWIGFIGQFKSKLADWASAHLKKFAFLEADAVALPGGQAAPLPQRNVAEPPVQALLAGKLQCTEEMKSSAGVFDPSLGQNKGDQSGRAIEQLRSEGDVANYHFISNLARSEWHEGRILVDLIPYYYDTQREIEILGLDMKAQVIEVNTPAPVIDKHTGKEYHHQLDQGKYKPIVKVGPSYDTKRERIFGELMDLAKGNPAVFPLIADVMFTYSDFEGADILAQRFKASLPPALQGAGEKQGLPPEVQMQLEQLTQHLEAAQNDLKNKISEKQVTADMQWKIAQLNALVKIRVAEVTASKDSDNQKADLDAQSFESMLDRMHDVALQSAQIEAAPQPEPAGAPAQ